MVHVQAQQVEVGDLVVTLNPGEVKEIVVAQGNIVRPEGMVQHAAGFTLPFAHLRYAQSAVAAVVGRAEHANDAVFDQWAGRDLYATLGSEGVRAFGKLVCIIKECNPDVGVEQGAHGVGVSVACQMPLRSISALTCWGVTTSSRSANRAKRPRSAG